MSEARIVFNHCAEALLRSVKGRMTPGLAARLATLEISPDAPLLPAYDHARWCEVIAVTAQQLLPELSPEDGHHQVGEWLTDAYLENFIGKALKPVVRLIGLRRTLGRMRQNFRVANNYAEAEVADVGPGHVTLRMNETGLMAYFNRGILARGLLLCDPKNLSVSITALDGAGATYDVRWDP